MVPRSPHTAPRKNRHEAPPRRVAAEFGEVDDAGERPVRDQTAESIAGLGGDRHIGMAAAKDDDRKARGVAVAAGAQPPPHPKRIDNGDPRARFQQSLDKPFAA